MNYRNVSTRGLDKAANAAKLNRPSLPKLTFHDLRHTYGSHLAQSGLDPVGVQRQLRTCTALDHDGLVCP